MMCNVAGQNAGKVGSLGSREYYMKTYPLRKIARSLFDRYAGHEGADLKDELAAVVMKYFSAGIETLHYGGGKQ